MWPRLAQHAQPGHCRRRQLVSMGVQVAIVTMAELACATLRPRPAATSRLSKPAWWTAPRRRPLTAGVVFGLLHNFPVTKPCGWGLRRRPHLQCAESVCPSLSLDRLYEEPLV